MIEARLRAAAGVVAVTVRPVTGSVVVAYDAGRVSAEAVLAACAGAGVQSSAQEPEPPTWPARVPDPPMSAAVAGGPGLATLSLLGATTALVAAFVPLPWPTGAALTLLAGLPIVARASHAIGSRGRLNTDALTGAALFLLVLRGSYRTASLLPWLLALGDVILARTVTRTRRSLRDLVVPPDQTAWRVENGGRARVPVSALHPGDVVLVEAGSRLLVDGRVMAGEALVDQRSITGEGLPVERRAGDPVYAFTAVEDGEITLEVQRTGLATSAGRIIEAIERRAEEKAELQVVAEHLADRQVGRTLILAAAGIVLSRRLDTGIAILVADYGMASRVAVPVSVLASVMSASRRGILIKGPRLLEKLARVDTVVFDKTGTLTLGMPRVSRVVGYGPSLGADDLVRLAAAAERGSRHPAARAIRQAARDRRLVVPKGGVREARTGLGIRVTVDERTVLVGSRRFLSAEHVEVDRAVDDEAGAHETGGSTILVAVDGRLAGLLVLHDELRPDAHQAVAELRARRMRNVIMVSGDHVEPTRVTAEALGVRHYHADVLPEDKAALIRGLRDEGRVVAMVGDGVNDALALQAADVGIAVPGGAEVLTEAAGVVLTAGGLEKVVEALDIARAAIVSIERTLSTAAKGNMAAVGLASLGFVGPAGAILLTNGAALGAALAALPGATARRA